MEALLRALELSRSTGEVSEKTLLRLAHRMLLHAAGWESAVGTHEASKTLTLLAKDLQEQYEA